jgi:hypothetical protein
MTLTPLKGTLARVKGLLQPFTKAEQQFRFLPVSWMKCFPVPLNFVLAPCVITTWLLVDYCRSQ